MIAAMTALESPRSIPRFVRHRCRLRAGDPVFEPALIRAGAAAGAVLELDLRPLSDGGFAILHDDDLARETSGTGPVSALDRAGLKALTRRGEDGRLIEGLDGRPLCTEDLPGLLAADRHRDTELQLDLKGMSAAFDARHWEDLARLAEGFAGPALLGGLDLPAVVQAGRAVPSLRLGWDPTYVILETMFTDRESGEQVIRLLIDQVEGARAAGAELSVIFLNHDLMHEWHAAGCDPIGAFAKAGLETHLWTLDPDHPQAEDRLAEARKAGAARIITNDMAGWSALLTA